MCGSIVSYNQGAREDRESIDAIALVQKIFPILICGKGFFLIRIA
jgi:hypothetical protein